MIDSMSISVTSDLRETQSFLQSLYSNDGVSVEFSVNKIVANCGVIAAQIEQSQFNSGPYIEVFSWANSICSHSDLELWEGLYRQFPGCCPHCLVRPCVCDVTGKIPQDISVVAREQELSERGASYLNYVNGGNPVDSLGEFLAKLAQIYPSNDTLWKVNPHVFSTKILKHAARLTHECTRLESGTRARNINAVLVDLLAWTFATWRLSMKEHAHFNASIAFYNRYKDGCPICSSSPCGCGETRRDRKLIFETVAIDDSDNDSKRELVRQIASLNKSLSKLDLSEIAIDVSAEDKDSVLSKLENTRRGIKVVGEASTDLEKIAIRISRLIDWVSSLSIW